MTADSKIAHIYFTRIVNNDEKKYGFALTDESESVYIPGRVIEDFDLSEDDVGTKNKAALMDEGEGLLCLTLLIEDSALEQAHLALQDEVGRLQAILDEHGISYDD